MRALVLLLAFVCCARAESIVKPLQVPASGKTGFTRIALGVTNRLSDALAQRNRIFEIGSGAALGDFDNDGLCDIYLPRLEDDNVLLRNVGNLRFEPVANSPALACLNEFSTGAVFADIDNDSDLDLLVTGIGHGTRLILNDGKGTFAIAENSGLERRFGATSMALADIDGDGDLDLYVCNYRTTTIKDNPNEARPEAKQVGDKIVVTPADRFEALVPSGGGVILVEKGEPDILYLNDGRGHFSAVSWTGGAFLDESGKPLASPPRDWALSAGFRDLNGDHLPDLYVCNDFFQSPDRIWINQGKGIFKALPASALRTISMSSMSVDFADINRDGHDDFFVADMLSPRNEARQRQRANVLKGDLQLPYADLNYRAETPRNTLFLNRGDGTFAEIAQLAGLEATDWTWGALFLDVDLDGFEDLLLATGNNHDVLDADSLRALQDRGPAGAAARAQGIRSFPRIEIPSLAFRNNGDLTFTNMSAAWGFDEPGIAHGMAATDLDNDGDLDVVVSRLNSSAVIYRNDSIAPRLLVKTKSIGARISVGAQSQVIASGGRYLSGDAQERMFAAGDKNTVRIEFQNKTLIELADIPPNSLCVVEEAGAKVSEQPSRPASKPLFTEVFNQSIPPDPAKPTAELKQLGFSFGVPGPFALLPGRDSFKLATAAAKIGDNQLVVLREWDTPMLYSNGKQSPLINETGWWSAIAAGDFNNDKKPDLLLGNWGRNTKFQSRLPVKAFYSDFNGDGSIDVIEAWTENQKLYPIRDLDTLAEILPNLRERFPNYRAFGEATIDQIVGSAKNVTATTLDSLLLINLGDNKFEPRPLPIEAQFSPVLSIAVGDFNRDSRADVFLGQNILDADQETSRLDSGAGLVLLNSGDAKFRALTPRESGIRLLGEARSAFFANDTLFVREKNLAPRAFKLTQ